MRFTGLTSYQWLQVCVHTNNKQQHRSHHNHLTPQSGARQLVALTTHTGPDQPHAIPGFSKGTLDRGAGVNKEKRDQLNERSLVDTGKYVFRGNCIHGCFFRVISFTCDITTCTDITT